MAEKKQKNKITMDGLANLIRQESQQNLNKLTRLVKSESKKNQEEMGKMVVNAFQEAQNLFVNRFEQMDKKIDGIHKEVQKVNLNIVDVVRKEEFDKLENRVVGVEETVNLQLKKA